MQGVVRVALVLLAGLPVQVFSGAVVAQESGRSRYDGRVPGNSDVNAASVAPAAGSSGNRAGDSPVTPGGTAQEPGGADGPGDPVLERDRHPLYRLRIGDVVDVTFAFSPELNQGLTVGPDGFIALKSAGSVYAAGKTVPELVSGIAAAYRGILRDPEVTVTLKDFERPFFLAMGQVGHPGKYELRGDVTVAQALAIAGGFTQRARHSQVLLFRRVSDEWAETRVVNVKRMLHDRNLAEDLRLRPGDLLFVPQSTVSNLQRFMPSTALGTYVNPAQF